MITRSSSSVTALMWFTKAMVAVERLDELARTILFALIIAICNDRSTANVTHNFADEDCLYRGSHSCSFNSNNFLEKNCLIAITARHINICSQYSRNAIESYCKRPASLAYHLVA
ncbi:hypothetical protein BJ878DRAFT_141823 [Calycina marina]|uniref:Uncharacterized protein n=1 Tax=Calycina marina TaxID=1763456 RepID=A0A9P8CIB2_9HELO|nr:hypothetical protein BJ878DRAFT_141823 [Calycina marina]